MSDDAFSKFVEGAFGYAQERTRELKQNGLRLAHYTTAENAALVLKGKSIWLRNAQVMNDFSEVSHGLSCLREALALGQAARLTEVLDRVHPGLYLAVQDQLNRSMQEALNFTYLTSLCEFDRRSEGKLSMWRAYGGRVAGVALVLKPKFLDEDSERLGAWSSPVAYGNAPEMFEHVLAFVNRIEAHLEHIAAVPFDNAKTILFNALQFAILSFKHPAFEEEREWRVIHAPLSETSAFITTSVETIRGVPQMVCRLPLSNLPGLNMPWMELDALLAEVLIGPCAHPKQVAWAFRELLREAGVTNPDKRIRIASIPLRHQE